MRWLLASNMKVNSQQTLVHRDGPARFRSNLGIAKKKELTLGHVVRLAEIKHVLQVTAARLPPSFLHQKTLLERKDVYRRRIQTNWKIFLLVDSS